MLPAMIDIELRRVKGPWGVVSLNLTSAREMEGRGRYIKPLKPS